VVNNYCALFSRPSSVKVVYFTFFTLRRLAHDAESFITTSAVATCGGGDIRTLKRYSAQAA
jgi:hypothetical protein